MNSNAMSEKELLPCPFCGKPAGFVAVAENSAEIAECSGCRISTPVAFFDQRNHREWLIKTWNTRVPAQPAESQHASIEDLKVAASWLRAFGLNSYETVCDDDSRRSIAKATGWLDLQIALLSRSPAPDAEVQADTCPDCGRPKGSPTDGGDIGKCVKHLNSYFDVDCSNHVLRHSPALAEQGQAQARCELCQDKKLIFYPDRNAPCPACHAPVQQGVEKL